MRPSPDVLLRAQERRVFVSLSALLVGALLFVVAPVSGQSIAIIHVDADLAARGDGTACRADPRTAKLKDGASARTTVDTVYVRVHKDGRDSTSSATLYEPLDVRLNLESVGTVATTDATRVFPLGLDALAGARVSLWRPNSTVPLCVLEPTPLAVTFAQSKAFTTHTDIMATGQVSTALRTGSENVATTGSLGFHHVSYPTDGSPRTHFLPGGYWKTIDGEDLRAVISVASSADSITGAAGNFAQSVLLPVDGGTGAFKSVDLQYFPFHRYGHKDSQEFGPYLRLAANQARWAPTRVAATAAHPDSLYPTTNAVIIAFDARLRWVAINRVSDTDDNSLSFTLDGGYIRRSIDGDVVADHRMRFAALGDSTRTHFGGWATGMYLRLRQVTAYADFQCLSCKFFGLKLFSHRNAPLIRSLEGLQPVIGFRFDAPFLTVPD